MPSNPRAPLRAIADLVAANPALVMIPLVWLIGTMLSLETVEGGPVLCLTRRVIGIPCGGCGMTRATVALAHGHLRAALGFHLLAPAAWVWAGWWWTTSIYHLARGRRVARSPAWVGMAMLVSMAIFWAARLVIFFGTPGAWERIAHDSLAVQLFRGR